ncbi:hypothetical protein ACEQPO_15730 [Bacillus sp. SL00103]
MRGQTTISNIQFLVSEKSPFPVVMGQVLVILVSEKLAKEVGMIDLMNYIYRDPIIDHGVCDCRRRS